MSEPQAAPAKAPQPTLRIHFLIPDDAGPVVSEGMAVNLPGGPVTVGGGKFRAACDPKLCEFGAFDRATGSWWAVACGDCFETPEFQHAQATITDPRDTKPPDMPAARDMPKPRG